MNLTPLLRSRLIHGSIVVGSILSFVALWHVGSLFLGDALPSPYSTVQTIIEVLQEPDARNATAIDHLFVSLRRVFIILAIALTLSVIIGVAMGLYESVEKLFSPWIPIGMTTPDVVVILIVMIFLGFDGSSIVLAIIFTATPFGVINMWEGMKDLDPDLIEMSRTFESSSLLMWRYIFIPHLLTYIFASTRYLLGMVWKVVLVGEAFGTQTGMGAVIRFWFNNGQLEPILAYLLLFIITIFIIEYLILKQLELRLFAWRE